MLRGLVCMLLALPVHAQARGGTASDLGRVRVPARQAGGAVGLPTGRWDGGIWRRTLTETRERRVEEWILPPPLSGNGELAERARIQFPVGKRPNGPAPLVVAWHSMGRSEAEPFAETDLAAECARRGWILVAPYGLVAESAGQESAQAALVALLGELSRRAPYDRRRIYFIGRRFGALSALSYALSHRDPREPRVAALLCDTPVLDLAREYRQGNERLRVALESLLGGGPEGREELYAASSPALRLPSGLIDPEAPIVQLGETALLLHLNLAAEPRRVEEGLELARFLAFRGGRVIEELSFDPSCPEGWGSLALGPALDALGRWVLEEAPQRIDLCTYRPARFGALDLLAVDGEGPARLEVEIEPGRVGLRGSRGLECYAIDLPAAGIDPSRTVELDWSDGGEAGGDASGDRVILRGYLSRPAEVRMNGEILPWAWNSERAELELLLPGWCSGRVTVLPLGVQEGEGPSTERAGLPAREPQAR